MSENQENQVDTPPRPKGRLLLNVAEHGIDGLSLNSPRSPLTLLNLSADEREGCMGTPKGSQKRPLRLRRVLSAKVLGPSSPRPSSTKPVSEDSGFSGSNESEGYRSLEAQLYSTQLPRQFPVVFSKVTQEEAGEMSINDLMRKPILNKGFSPIQEESEHESHETEYYTRALSGFNAAFKRPSPPGDENRHASKRTKSIFDPKLDTEEFQVPKCKQMIRAVSETTMTVKTAVERINSNPGLVGDGSKLHILPIMRKGNHSDLKEITPADLVALTEGQYSEDVKSFEVIDCRYPYEYEGGHIRGAINLHTKRQVYERFFGSKGPCISVEEGRRHIIVFHCEFSSQRAPEMCRYVRDCDRKMNEYPFLHYPELYVLFGGYKAFFLKYKINCTPQSYLTMIDEKFAEQFRFFKSMSKTDVMATTKKNYSKSQGKLLARSSSTKKLQLDHL